MQMRRKRETVSEEEIEEVRSFLCSYQLCADMLGLRQFERRRRRRDEEEMDFDDLLAGDEAFWRARMLAVRSFVSEMRNGREKLMIYYYFLQGERIEHASETLNVSRRTGYRMLQRGLCSAALLYQKKKKINGNFGLST